jgi:enediyne biosynthesis protein E4
VSGHDGKHFFLPEMACGGAALFDADGDGDLDAYLVQSGGLVVAKADRPASKLFLNRGDGTFVDSTKDSGADVRSYGMGVAAGDYDDDGRVDLYVTAVDGGVLLHNEGGGRFADVTVAAGAVDPDWGSSAAFFDFDKDGDLDLFVVNYVRWSPQTERQCEAPLGGPDYCGPKTYQAPTPARLYRNEGGGRFADVSEAAGLRTAFGNGLGVVTADFDGDGWEDVFVANDGTPNQLWINEKGGKFVDKALIKGCAMDNDGIAKAGMGIIAFDVDDDSDLDVFVANLAGESDSYFRNEGGRFSDRTATVGLGVVSRQFTRFGMGVYDFDHDARPDLYVATGRVMKGREKVTGDPYAEEELLFRGVASGRFEEVRPRGGTAQPLAFTSRGAAFGDVDGDGAIDVLVVERDAPAHLLRNVVKDRGHWLLLKILEKTGRDALGAVVVVPLGARRLTRVVHSAESYCAASDPRVHLGLGTATSVGPVTVRWVDGATETFAVDGADRVATLRRGEGTSR